MRSEPSGRKSKAEASKRSPCDGVNCHDSAARRECLGWVEDGGSEEREAGVGRGALGGESCAETKKCGTRTSEAEREKERLMP